MAYNSYIFILAFLPCVLIVYYILGKIENKVFSKIWLIFSSLFFLGFYNRYYVYILIISALVNYLLGYLILKTSAKRLFMVLGIIFNIAFLAYFKYYNFFITSMNSAFDIGFTIRNIIIPLGISFFTFQQLSFIIDQHRNNNKVYNFIDYFTYVSFFPNLISGPIVFHSEIIPQIKDKTTYRFNSQNFAEGITLFIVGLGKKVLIADVLAQVVTWGFNDVSIADMDSTNAIIVALCYTLQIYFDFSGYSDMAIGLAKMFNIKLLQNFNSPYKAFTIAEFWRRWHISLTRFLTQYLYIPLGGNRKGQIRTYINVFLVFFISGIWHGANYTFIVWGIMHGVASLINKKFQKQIDKLHPAFNWIVTFIYVCVAWVIFRADNLTQGFKLIGKMFDCSFSGISENISSIFLTSDIEKVLSHFGVMGAQRFLPIIFIGFAMLIILLPKNIYEILKKRKWHWKNAVILALLFAWSVFSLSGITSFIYFNF